MNYLFVKEECVMNNDFTNYLNLISNYSIEEIKLQFVLSCVISLLYLLVVWLLLKIIPVTVRYKKQYFSCGFLISLIINTISPYFSVNASTIWRIDTIFDIALLIFFIIVFSLLEYFIVYPLATEKKHLKKCKI